MKRSCAEPRASWCGRVTGPSEIRPTPWDRFTATNATARSLVLRAYGLLDAQLIGAPSWSRCLVEFAGLEPGRYTLKADGKAITTQEAETWEKGIALQSGPNPDFDQVEALRKAINEKNLLYFHR